MTWKMNAALLTTVGFLLALMKYPGLPYEGVSSFLPSFSETHIMYTKFNTSS